LGFNERSHFVVKHEADAFDNCKFHYEHDYQVHESEGNRNDPPSWVIPPTRRVTISTHCHTMIVSLPEEADPSHQGYPEYRAAIQKFRDRDDRDREPRGNDSPSLSNLHLRTQSVTASARSGKDRNQPAPVDPGQKAGRWAWVIFKDRVLGSGAHGEVREAFNSTTWQMAAAKIMRDGAKLAHDSKVLRSLTHPHVAKYIDEEQQGYTPEAPALIIEYCHLKDVAYQHTKSGNPLTEGEIFQVVTQTASALKYLHEMRVCHRDIKPYNILVRSRAHDRIQIAVTDFGIARVLESDDGLMSTYRQGIYECMAPEIHEYMAPEILGERTMSREKVDEKYDEKADIWSMGILIIYNGQGFQRLAPR
jgi:hypothetical protein